MSYPEVKLALAPMSLQNSLQNRDTNWGPQSETMSLGNRWTLNTVIMTSAVSLADGNLGRAINLTILENGWCYLGSPVMKSMDMSDHGLEGMGSGCRGPMRDPEDVLFRAQTEHASMYSWTSGSMDGHQNHQEMTNIVLLTPG